MRLLQLTRVGSRLIAAATLLTTAGCSNFEHATDEALRPPGTVVPITAANVDDAQEPAMHLRADRRTSGQDLGAPGALLLVDSAVVVVDASPGERPILAFHQATLERLGSFSRVGSGPGELRDPWYLAPDPRDARAFWVLDITLQKLMQLRPELLNQGASPTSRELSTSRVAGATAFVWSSDTTALFTGTLRDGRVATLVGSSGQVTFGGTLRGNPAVEPMFRNLAYEVRPVMLGGADRVALMGMHTGDIELVDMSGAHLGFAETAHRFDPLYRPWREGERRSYVPSDSLRFGYVWGTASPRLLYGLFSGRMRLKSTRGSSFIGKWVHVFDHDGTPCARLVLDEDAIAITVDAGDTFLFASTHGENPGVARYPLPAPLCANRRR